jgi:LPXTG-motif cell wall-anchored protein
MKSGINWMRTVLVSALGTMCIFFAASSIAQVQTQQTTTPGQAAKEVTVERGEVILVEGNDLMVKMEDGSIRHFPNVPESAKVTVDGRLLGIHDLKPGMKLQRTITTTKTPQTVTTVQTVTGKVWHVTPPLTVVLTLEDGTNQSFKIPKGQKFKVNGEMVDAFSLKKGMIINATKIVEVPETVVSQQRKVTGTMPPPPPAPPADVPILVATTEATPPPAPAASAAAAPAKLPKTGSDLPLIGLLGLLCVSASLGVKFLRSIGGL